MNKRIGYLDAMRGFTMLLVVYNHVLLFSFGGVEAWSFNDVFVTFRMPLFFFLSGFLMFKSNRFCSWSAVGEFLRKKGMVQLIPTLVFSVAYAVIMQVSYSSLLTEKAKCGFWFTYTLFYYFVIYSLGDFLVSKFAKGRIKVLTGLLVALGIYAFSKFSLSPSFPWYDSPVSGIIGFANFQFFLFFFLGALARSRFSSLERLLDNAGWITGIIVIFVVLQIMLQVPVSREWIISKSSYSGYSLLKSLSGLFGIAAVLISFRNNEQAILNSKAGCFLQYIGERTLDIYLIHLFLIHTNLTFAGQFLCQYHSPVLELVLGMVTSLIIIGLCLIISYLIRSSDILAKLLFGKVIKR